MGASIKQTTSKADNSCHLASSSAAFVNAWFDLGCPPLIIGAGLVNLQGAEAETLSDSFCHAEADWFWAVSVGRAW